MTLQGYPAPKAQSIRTTHPPTHLPTHPPTCLPVCLLRAWPTSVSITSLPRLPAAGVAEECVSRQQTEPSRQNPADRTQQTEDSRGQRQQRHPSPSPGEALRHQRPPSQCLQPASKPTISSFAAGSACQTTSQPSSAPVRRASTLKPPDWCSCSSVNSTCKQRQQRTLRGGKGSREAGKRAGRQAGRGGRPAGRQLGAGGQQVGTQQRCTMASSWMNERLSGAGAGMAGQQGSMGRAAGAGQQGQAADLLLEACCILV